MAFSNPLDFMVFPAGAGTGQMRMVVGANTPPELVAYGIGQAILAYITDVGTGVEIGYLWIGSSNRFDGLGTGRVLAYGNVTYPVAGVPTSATVNDVKTNFQQNMWAQSPQTIFKDHTVTLWCGFSGESVNALTGDISFRWDDEEIPRGPSGTIASGRVTLGATTTVGGAEKAIPVATWDAEPNFTFKAGHIYEIKLRYALGITAAVVTSGQVRLRKGSASIVGQVLWSNSYNYSSNFSYEGVDHSVYVKNTTVADITTKLSLTIARTAGAGVEWSIAGFAIGQPQLDVILQDLGLENRSGHGHPWTGMAASIV